MEKAVKITLIIVLGILILSYFGSKYFVPTQNTVTVTGESSIKVMPDVISIVIGIETDGTTSKEAEDKNSEIYNNLTDYLISQGFTKEQIQTQSFNIYPTYNWASGKQNIVGYKANHQIKLELPAADSEKVGIIIDSATTSKATISYVNFELSQAKQNEYKAEAIKLAAQDAKIKAEAMAQGLGKKLGGLISTSDSSFDYYPYPLYQASAGATAEDAKVATTNIQPSEQTINSRVSAVFKIK